MHSFQVLYESAIRYLAENLMLSKHQKQLKNATSNNNKIQNIKTDH